MSHVSPPPFSPLPQMSYARSLSKSHCHFHHFQLQQMLKWNGILSSKVKVVFFFRFCILNQDEINLINFIFVAEQGAIHILNG